MSFILSTRLVLRSIVMKSGCKSTTGPPDLQFSSPVLVSAPDATAKPMASCHFFAPPCQADAVPFRSSCLLDRPSLRCPSIGLVVNIMYIRKYKDHFALNTNIKSSVMLHIQCGRSLDRTETVWKWSRERRARTGLRESSGRDKAMRS